MFNRITGMWSGFRNAFLKLLALTAVLSFSYPVMLVVRIRFFDTDGGAIAFLCSFFATFMGLAAARLIIRREYGTLQLVTAYAVSVVPLSGLLLIYHDGSAARIVFEIIPVLLYYITGMRSYFCRYHDILGNSSLGAGIVMLSSALFISYFYSKTDYLRGSIYIFAYAFMLLAIVLKSMENVDGVFLKRGIDSRNVQRKIRRKSLKDAFLLYIVILFLFNLKVVVLFVFNLIKIAANKIVWLIIYIIKLLLRDKKGNYEEQFGFMPFDPRPSMRPVVILILSTLCCFVVLYSMYKLLPVIFRKFKRLVALAKRMLLKLLQKRITISSQSSDEYVDEIEFTGRKIAEGDGVPDGKNPALRRTLDKITDPAEKIRSIYAHTIIALRERNIKIAKSDTTGEIYHKSVKIDGLDVYLSQVTGIYELVRYGEKKPGTGAVSIAEENYKNIEKILD